MDNVEKGKTIEHKDNVFFLKKGSVKIVNTTHDTVTYVVKRGSVFGKLAFYNKEAADKEVTCALENCIICYLYSEQMELLMEKYKSLKNGVLKTYGLRIWKLRRRLHDLLYKDYTTKIREFISDYLEAFGQVKDDSSLIAKKMFSHKEIVNLTKSSRQTVSNVLSRMRKEEIVDYNVQFISDTKLSITNEI